MNTLRKWQKNEVFKAVEAARLLPEEFNWDDGGGDAVFRHRPSGAYFVFGGNAGRYDVRYLSGDGDETTSEIYGWQTLMERLQWWLADVRSDTETPDLWAELLRQTEALSAVSNEHFENTLFTPSERGEIAERLVQLRENAKASHPLSEEQAANLALQLDYAVDALDRVGRKDWFLMFCGTLMTFLISAALPPDVARDISRTFVAHLLGHLFPLLGS